jgi:hypothetical protein
MLAEIFVRIVSLIPSSILVGRDGEDEEGGEPNPDPLHGLVEAEE